MRESNNRHLACNECGVSTVLRCFSRSTAPDLEASAEQETETWTPNGACGDAQCNRHNSFLEKNSGKPPIHHPHKYCHNQAGTRRRA